MVAGTFPPPPRLINRRARVMKSGKERRLKRKMVQMMANLWRQSALRFLGYKPSHPDYLSLISKHKRRKILRGKDATRKPASNV